MHIKWHSSNMIRPDMPGSCHRHSTRVGPLSSRALGSCLNTSLAHVGTFQYSQPTQVEQTIEYHVRVLNPPLVVDLIKRGLWKTAHLHWPLNDSRVFENI